MDTYGGYCPHGGGAFSGKDPSKVDRSAAYAARHAAKNLVAAGLCDRCQIAVSYAIGVARPVSLTVDTFGTGKLPEDVLARLVDKVFDMRPAAIIDRLDLRRPIYRATAAYGTSAARTWICPGSVWIWWTPCAPRPPRCKRAIKGTSK